MQKAFPFICDPTVADNAPTCQLRPVTGDTKLFMASCSSAELARRKAKFSSPRFDQTTYSGRVQHFWQICKPWYIFATHAQLEEASARVDAYVSGTAPEDMTEEDAWEARHLAASAFHPDTGQPMNVAGRMCFQPTGSSSLSAVMLTWGLKSTGAQLLLQWINQSYMALLNYSNRNASRDGPELRSRAMQAYVCATAASFVAAVGFGRLAKRSTGVLAQKLVPMTAVAVSTCINVPIMRSSELSTGISVSVGGSAPPQRSAQSAGSAGAPSVAAAAVASAAAAAGGTTTTTTTITTTSSSSSSSAPMASPTVVPTPSKTAAQIAVGSVCLSRVVNASADLIFPPLMVAAAQRRGYAWASSTRVLIPVYLVTCFCTIAVSTPITCAILPQRLGVPVRWLEKEVREEIKRADPSAEYAYINKGL